MIYKGPTIVKEIKKGLVDILKEKGFKNIVEAVGSSSN
jgi:dihydroorotate dehydrogenase